MQRITKSCKGPGDACAALCESVVQHISKKILAGLAAWPAGASVRLDPFVLHGFQVAKMMWSRKHGHYWTAEGPRKDLVPFSLGCFSGEDDICHFAKTDVPRTRRIPSLRRLTLSKLHLGSGRRLWFRWSYRKPVLG